MSIAWRCARAGVLMLFQTLAAVPMSARKAPCACAEPLARSCTHCKGGATNAASTCVCTFFTSAVSSCQTKLVMLVSRSFCAAALLVASARGFVAPGSSATTALHMSATETMSPSAADASSSASETAAFELYASGAVSQAPFGPCRHLMSVNDALIYNLFVCPVVEGLDHVR